jgi:hypothetical protein
VRERKKEGSINDTLENTMFTLTGFVSFIDKNVGRDGSKSGTKGLATNMSGPFITT